MEAITVLVGLVVIALVLNFWLSKIYMTLKYDNKNEIEKKYEILKDKLNNMTKEEREKFDL